ncbi:MAG: FtsH protease activity modulator HflK [Thermodesulfobacteriota bacterium]
MNWDWEKLSQQQKSRRPGGPEGGGVPPQMDELVNKIKNMKFSAGPLLIIGAILLLLIGSTMVYKVEQREVGVIQRFGKYVRTTYPGLHFKLPMGIEALHIVNVEEHRPMGFGLSTAQPEKTLFSRNQAPSNAYDESLMLTGDLNVAIVPWVVQYNIKDPTLFLFRVHEAEVLLRDLAEATMRLVVGDRSINEVILVREEIASECRNLLQKELDDAETGIHVAALELGKTNVPPKVQPSFNAVNKAEQEKETMIFNARKEYNQAIPAAMGEAEKTIRNAEGYALDRVNRAEGDADKFLALYREYTKARDVTRRRLYLETMKEVLPKLGKKYLIDEDQKNVLPLLNLETGNKGGTK